MANPTSNFGWQMPTPTDLVTDLPADFEVFGQAVDTSLADLKGGTTGQVLSKTSGTDMDFTWVDTDDANAIQNAIVNAKGDIIGASANDVPAITSVGADGTVLVADSSTSTGLSYQGNFAAGKNKFINGNMAIAQRSAAAVTVTAGSRFFSPDRTFGQLTGAGVYTVEQVVDAPAAANAGQYSMKAVVTTADTSLAASDQYFIGQIIEGLDFALFQFGTAEAQTVTISFWVKSSITGTFGVDIRNSAANRSYVSTYTISASNTWEKKTVTITGDTSGTWLQDTGIGARIEWNLGAGTDLQTATPNAWTATNDQTTASQTNWMATVANTFQITAIQIEAGSVATAFQTATGNFASELAACQRYYWRTTTTAATGAVTGLITGKSTTAARGTVKCPVSMRVGAFTIDYTGTLAFDSASAFDANVTTISLLSSNPDYAALEFAAAAGLTQYRPYFVTGNASAAAYLGFSAEL